MDAHVAVGIPFPTHSCCHPLPVCLGHLPDDEAQHFQDPCIQKKWFQDVESSVFPLCGLSNPVSLMFFCLTICACDLKFRSPL